MKLQPTPGMKTREFILDRKNGEWRINGKSWDPKRSDADVPPGAVEIWDIETKSGGWFHPLHIHLIDFKILDRNGKPPFDYELGPKDVVYVGENERVRLIAKFGPRQGRYMIHCHNLVHEDHDMMTHFDVGPTGEDPAAKDPAKDLPAPPL
jgi:FtsP/CotA-like multicopper oxidase with cupredoxin domain